MAAPAGSASNTNARYSLAFLRVGPFPSLGPRKRGTGEAPQHPSFHHITSPKKKKQPKKLDFMIMVYTICIAVGVSFSTHSNKTL